MPSGISAGPSQNVYMTPQHPLRPRLFMNGTGRADNTRTLVSRRTGTAGSAGVAGMTG
jgi:hypothetical protein